MAILSAPSSTAFDNISPNSGVVTARGPTSVSLSFTVQASKQNYNLKLNGSFDAQGRPTAIEELSYTPPDGLGATLSFPFGLSSLDLDLQSSPVRIDRLLQKLLADDDIINLGDAADAIHAGGGNDVVNTGGGADRVTGGAGDDAINGGAGVDAATYFGQRAAYTLQLSGNRATVNDSTGTEGRDTLTAVERLNFSDVGVALDIDGNAGTVAKILGAVFGPTAVGNREYAGIGLRLLDGGQSYTSLCELAVQVTGRQRPADVVDLLWTNVVGSRPTAEQAQPFIDLMTQGMSIGQLTVFAADYSLNLDNIDLVGLSKTGLEFI